MRLLGFPAVPERRARVSGDQAAGALGAGDCPVAVDEAGADEVADRVVALVARGELVGAIGHLANDPPRPTAPRVGIEQD